MYFRVVILVFSLQFGSVLSLGVIAKFQNPLEAFVVPSVTLQLTGRPTLKAYPETLTKSGDWLTVAWEGVEFPSSDDLVALYVPADADPRLTAPVKFKKAVNDAGHLSQGTGKLRFRVLNMRSDAAVAFLRGGLDAPKVVAWSNRIRFANYNEPTGLHLALTGQVGEMRITWTTRDKGQDPSAVCWGRTPGALDLCQNASWVTYSEANTCGGAASSVGWISPGVFHSAVMNGLSPHERIFYRVGSAALGFSTMTRFYMPPPVGASSPLHLLAYGDLGQAEIDGSFDPNDQMEPSLVTMRRMLADEYVSGGDTSRRQHGLVVLHIGDISYARGYVSQWDNFFDQIEPLASQVPYMVGIGNHERDWPGSGSLFDGDDSGGECGLAFNLRLPMPPPSLPAASPSSPSSSWWPALRSGITALRSGVTAILGPRHTDTGHASSGETNTPGSKCGSNFNGGSGAGGGEGSGGGGGGAGGGGQGGSSSGAAGGKGSHCVSAAGAVGGTGGVQLSLGKWAGDATVSAGWAWGAEGSMSYVGRGRRWLRGHGRGPRGGEGSERSTALMSGAGQRPWWLEDRPWYSFDNGMAHIVMMSTEHDFSPSSPQYAFLKQDLGAVVRELTPWIIFNGHRPMYIDSINDDEPAGDLPVGRLLQKWIEPLLLRYRVDLALWGHHHSYQRTCPLNGGNCVAGRADGTNEAPVHLVIGMAGAGTCTNIKPIAPPWIRVVNIEEHGYLRMSVNSSALHFQFIGNDQGAVIDEGTIRKILHAGVSVS